MTLAPGQTYTTPDLLVSWAHGLDAMAHRFHGWLRTVNTLSLIHI